MNTTSYSIDVLISRLAESDAERKESSQAVVEMETQLTDTRSKLENRPSRRNGRCNE